MRLREITEGVGRITKQNQTVDVGPDEVTKQAAKFGNKVDKDGRPPTLSKKVKGKSTNVLFNLGLAEGYKLQLERDKELLVLHIKDTATGKRTEVRGKSGYESGNYDSNDRLHKLLDKLGKSVDISQLMNGEPVGIRPNHPDGASAKDATDKAYNENFADGKKKGKSRPGRVKRSGASCNGSVTALRKRAKNASGEKAKMYHWCANMKSGSRKKK